MRRSLRAVLVVIAALSTACAPDGLAFREDTRVTITAPRERAEVELPLQLKWRAEGVDDGSFAVFVDRAPVRPGKAVVALAPKVFITDETSLVVTQVERGPNGQRDRHTATIVLLDNAGRRAGESAWDVVFEVKQGAQP